MSIRIEMNNCDRFMVTAGHLIMSYLLNYPQSSVYK